MKFLMTLGFLALVFAPFLVRAEKIKIGVSLPLTGALANYGADAQRALRFANTSLASDKYELLFQDDQNSLKEATFIAHRFSEIDKVRFVLGFMSSGSLLAAAPIYQRHGVIVIASLASSPQITKAGDHIFRTSPSDTVAGEMLNKLLSQKYRTVGVFSEETDYCEGILAALQHESKVRYEIERFHPGNQDFRSLILRLRRKSPQALVLNPQTDGALIELVKQIKAANWKTPLYGAYFPASRTFLEAAGELANGITFVDMASLREVLKPKALEVYDRFIKESGAPLTMDYLFELTYNSFVAMHETVLSGQDPKSFLHQHEFAGLSGPFSFDKNGDVIGITPVIKTIQAGLPIMLKPAGAEL